MIIRHAAWPSGIGILIGESAALGIETILSNYLYGVTAEDPLTYASVSAFLASVGLGASYLPSRRAAAIDPLEALRIE
jgi:putative ABC transport system permease protein